MLNEEDRPDADCWYVVHTHPKQEERVHSNLQAWNVESFLPRMRECRYNNFTGEPSYATKPLFPGYLFVRVNIENAYHKLRYTKGVHSLVCFGGNPASVDEEVISTIKLRMLDDGFVVMNEEFNPGDEVRIEEGAFKNLTGVFARNMKATDRVMILLNTINYQPRTEIDKCLVKRFAPKSHMLPAT